MTHRAKLWSRFLDPQFWCTHAMVAVWLIFAIMLCAVEPLFAAADERVGSSREGICPDGECIRYCWFFHWLRFSARSPEVTVGRGDTAFSLSCQH